MTTIEPLTAAEEALWRAVMRIVKFLPRNLDSDLIRGGGLTASEYTTLMHLSEAPNRELRMAYLAKAGRAKLKSAWPVHLASVRRHFMDSLDGANVELVATALAQVAAHLEDS